MRQEKQHILDFLPLTQSNAAVAFDIAESSCKMMELLRILLGETCLGCCNIRENIDDAAKDMKELHEKLMKNNESR